MGNSQSLPKINFEDIQYAIKNKESHLLINTLDSEKQDCLILNTVLASQEENLLNKIINSNYKNIKIIVYGENDNDEKIYKKYRQLSSLGFYNVYIYMGGMFEWLMLQDIYGFNEFPTTKKQLDLLKFKPPKKLNIFYIDNQN
jgi:rhodanese-related sulfurtransferase